MVETANKYVNEYTEALGKLTREDKLQKKVLSIQQHMAQHCATFAAMGFNGPTWELQIETRVRQLNQGSDILTQYDKALEPLPTDERFAFILYAHANWFLHHNLINQHLDKLTKAMESGQPEKAFEPKIILGTIYAILREWRAWWQENGTFPFDRWTYEDSPWEEADKA
jgi:hypothetical protein